MGFFFHHLRGETKKVIIRLPLGSFRRFQLKSMNYSGILSLNCRTSVIGRNLIRKYGYRIPNNSLLLSKRKRSPFGHHLLLTDNIINDKLLIYMFFCYLFKPLFGCRGHITIHKKAFV